MVGVAGANGGINSASGVISLAEFIAFSDDIWQQQQARTTALALQDQYHIEPNLLLLAIYAEQHKLYLNQEQFELLNKAQQHWVTHMLQPYRQLRKLGKEHLPESDYSQMLKVELTLERRSQQLMVRALQRLSPQAEGDNLAALLSALKLEPHTLPGTLLEQLGQLFNCCAPELPTYHLQ